MELRLIFNNILQSKNSPHPQGIFSICSANSFVLDSCIKFSEQHDFPLVIETTCNQVNQFGGYTGKTPECFVQYISDLASKNNVLFENIILGGDHLGPSPWTNLPAEKGMERSVEMVRQYIRAGYRKIHLDASMPCMDDPVSVSENVIHEREAILCQAAVDECNKNCIDLDKLVFVVGTEVPTPGGSTQDEDVLCVSNAERTENNIEQTRKVFFEHGLEKAWQRIHAFVAQPGVEFSDSVIFEYDRNKAKELSYLIESYPNLVFEAHSTDYQTRKGLRELVEDHFSVLKVGPALTFALRETLCSLELIEKELSSIWNLSCSNFSEVVESEMLRQSEYWVRYYSNEPAMAKFQRKFSLSDRSRYYLSNVVVLESIQKLLENLEIKPIPYSLLSQYLPVQYKKIRSGELINHPRSLITSSISDVVSDYFYACSAGDKTNI